MPITRGYTQKIIIKRTYTPRNPKEFDISIKIIHADKEFVENIADIIYKALIDKEIGMEISKVAPYETTIKSTGEAKTWKKEQHIK